MYAGNYDYGNNPAGSSPYNSGAPPPGSQNSVMQPGSAPNQQMMYNAQQFPMAQQSFPGNPAMMPTVGPGGMMQSAAMPHMAANGQMPNYQASYSNAPYGAGVPTSVPPQMNMPPNYGMGGGMPMGGFPVQQGMNPQQQQQQMMQRMQAAQPNANMPTPTQRNFTGQQPSQRTPTPNNGQAPPQPQLAGPQNTSSSQAGPSSGANATQQQAPTQVSSSNSIQTPQTPMFPAPTQGNTANGTSSTTTPLSPGTDPKDKERFSLVLEINNELLAEAINIQNTQQAIKKERAAANGTDGQANDGDKKTTEDELLGQDYFQCMRRLQTNLTYLAAIADKKGQQLPCPAYLKPPTLNTSIKLRGPAAPDGTETKIELPDREETSKFIIDLYKKLQGLYPGVDPNREPTFTMPSGSGRAGAQGPGSTASGTQTPSQASPVPGKQKTPTMANSAPPQTAGISAP